MDRLVLGSGALGRRLVESLLNQRGSLRVATEDDQYAESLRNEGIAVQSVDPTDVEALRALETPDIAVVADDRAVQNQAIARAVREVFPSAYLVAYAGTDAVDHGECLSWIADKFVDPGRATANHVLSRIGDGTKRLRQLWKILRATDRLGIIAHENPDPDAIASGIALARLADAADCSSEVCYYGDITHHENRAFVNLLDLDLCNLDADDDISEFNSIALVDHSRPGVNNQLPEGTPIDIVIDHHPPRAPIDARFVDLRSDVGATSTLLVDYLEEFDVTIPETVATALLFGIHVDTDEFRRGVVQQDFEAAAALVESADIGMLERIESPSFSPQTLDTVGTAIQNRTVEGEVLLSCVGELSNRDALAQAADRLLELEGVTTTLVYGVRDETIYISARARGSDVDLGETVRDAFGAIGSAGGHADMAGAQITVGTLDTIEEQEQSLETILESVVTDRFLEAIEANARRSVTGVYPNTAGGEWDYLVTDDE